MAVTCGFFNSLNHDRKYNSEQISRIFDGIIRDGVYMSIGDKLAVTATSGFTVNVGSGRAWFDHTWTYNDTDLPIELDAPDLVLDRYDAIILEVNSSEEVRNNTIKPLYGTASSDPQKPAMAKTEFVHQVPLAFIKRKPGSTEITVEDIEIVVGQADCPYVTSVLEAADITELFAQWDAQFNGWQTEQKAEFEAWFEGIKGQLGTDPAGHLQNQINEMKEEYSGYFDRLLNGFVVNLPSNGWTGEEAPYSQTVSVEGMTSDRKFSTPTSGDNTNALLDVNEALGLICGVESSNESITVYASDKPRIDLSIILRG